MATGMQNMADGTFYEVDPALAAKDAEIARLRAEADALRAGIAKALDELEDDGPKAAKYAAQELRAAMGAYA